MSNKYNGREEHKCWLSFREKKEKERKGNILNHKFERFKMQEHESIKEIFTRFTTVVNELNALGKKYTTHQRIKKIMRSLLKIQRPKVTVLTEAKNLTTLSMDELIGSLKVHEQELMDEYKYVKGKIIALKDSEKTKTKHHSYALNYKLKRTNQKLTIYIKKS